LCAYIMSYEWKKQVKQAYASSFCTNLTTNINKHKINYETNDEQKMIAINM
jgi:hypothetical protein